MNNLEDKNIKLSASILNLKTIEVHSRLAELKGLVDYIHIDTMDGVFVPNKTEALEWFKNAKRTENIPLDVHLMVENPLSVVPDYNGASIITFHLEAIINPRTMTVDMEMFYALASLIRSMGAKVGIAIKPNTTISLLRNILKKVDLVLVMTVEPGFGGQKLIPATLVKIEKVREMGFDGILEVDGGITTENAIECINRGADMIVAGTAIFTAEDPYDSAWKIKQK